LADRQAHLDAWLLDQTQGQIAFVLAWEPIEAAALAPGALGETLRRVEVALARRKAARFAAVLRPGGRWQEAAFLRPAIGDGADICEACHKATAAHTTAEGARRCTRCAADTET